MLEGNDGDVDSNGGAGHADSGLPVPPRAPVMLFHHPVVRSSGPTLPLLAMTPPPTSAVVLSLMHAFAVGSAALSLSPPAVRGEPSKRRRSGVDGSDQYTPGCEDADDDVDATTRNRKKKKKYSYVARREEREQLEKEVRELEERAQQLRSASAQTGPANTHVVSFENSRMREAVRERQRVFASVQSVITEFTIGQSAAPLNSYIHLTSGEDQRRDALLSLREPKLEEARRFLAARTQDMTPGRESWEEKRFRTHDGDYCGVRLDVTTYRGTTVKTVLDGILFFILNAEISISEVNGSLTVRENDEELFSEQSGVLQHRLVTSVAGLLVEKNAAVFYERVDETESEPGGEYALITSDCVDRDDAQPYQPSERIRKDLTLTMKIETVRSSDPESGGKEEEEVVVLTRSIFMKLHAPQLTHRQVSKLEMEALQRELMAGVDGILTSVQRSVAASSAGSR